MKDILVAVVIPVYNVENYLKDSIKSVLNQTYKNFEIVLVDDGSADNCPGICDQYANQYRHIRVIHKVNGGLASARNAGLKLLAEDENKPEYLLFLDSDDRLDKDALSGMVRIAERYGSDMIIPDRYYKVSEKTKKVSLERLFPPRLYRIDPKEFVVDTLIANGCAWRAHCVMYKFKLLQEKNIVFPEGRISEDFSFNVKALQFAREIRIYPYPVLYYTRRNNSISQSFYSNYMNDIIYIDEVACKFLSDTGKDDREGKEKVDALLCRMLTVQIIKAMSHKNPDCYKKRKQYCVELINQEFTRGALRKKHHIPYFSNAINRMAIGIAYFMFRHKFDNIAFRLFSLI